MSILTDAVVDMGLDWAVREQPAKRWMSRSFLSVSRQMDSPQRPAPFFPEIHEDITRSSHTPYSVRAHGQGTQLFTVVVGGWRNGVTCEPHQQGHLAEKKAQDS